jgi:hypothetical protein
MKTPDFEQKETKGTKDFSDPEISQFPQMKAKPAFIGAICG